ncbi:hypothetical protein BESB_080670 [Besnoitia besnoiti]|uniref:Uncharacterized protein n=1 Tax=Besnoitia besnoiti TaxID=94643 RepID=A0A2A9MC02_BESBE|nr:hypothetical protein BESB_080670 [Besnoitia besnoiti]PFH33851.1 hypothetical protein BESB_080670 [Besnoitia besnoiti]
METETTSTVSVSSDSVGKCPSPALKNWKLTHSFMMDAVAELKRHPYSLDTTTVQVHLAVSATAPLRGGSGYFHSRFSDPVRARDYEGPDNVEAIEKQARLRTYRENLVRDSNVFLYVNGRAMDSAQMRSDHHLKVDIMAGDQRLDITGKLVELYIDVIHTREVVEFDLSRDRFFPLRSVCIEVDGCKHRAEDGQVSLCFSGQYPQAVF